MLKLSKDIDIVVDYKVRVFPKIPPKDLEEEFRLKQLEVRLSCHAHKWSKVAEETFQRQVCEGTQRD